MHARTLTACALAFSLLTSPAFATDEPHAPIVAPTIAATAATLVQNLQPLPSVHVRQPPTRPAALAPLYAGTVALHSFDVYSTLTVLQAGGREANPLMKSITQAPPVFIGLKAGLAVGSIYWSERMWKEGHRTRAILMMVATNSVLTFVAARNARVLARIDD